MVRGRQGLIQSSHFTLPSSPRGMTLVELLIVIVIIGILVGSVLVASTMLIKKSKARNTQGVLQIVSDAVEQFKRTETEKPALTRNANYKKRYGAYPPDELEVFSNATIPGIPTKLATPAGSVIVPAPPYADPMRFYTDGTATDSLEHRDLAALIVAVESQGGEAAAVLDRISDRNRSAGVLVSGKPTQYLSRPTGINPGSINSDWGPEDLQIRYILDDWGIPICYMAQRDFDEDASPPTAVSSNHPAWNEASTELIGLNGGQPLIFSLGSDGKEQTSSDLVSTAEGVTFMGDFEPQSATPENKEHVIDHPANADNVYANEQLKEKLAKGIQ